MWVIIPPHRSPLYLPTVIKETIILSAQVAGFAPVSMSQNEAYLQPFRVSYGLLKLHPISIVLDIRRFLK
jgi:hypothetical protein